MRTLNKITDVEVQKERQNAVFTMMDAILAERLPLDLAIMNFVLQSIAKTGREDAAQAKASESITNAKYVANPNLEKFYALLAEAQGSGSAQLLNELLTKRL